MSSGLSSLSITMAASERQCNRIPFCFSFGRLEGGPAFRRDVNGNETRELLLNGAAKRRQWPSSTIALSRELLTVSV